MRAVILQHDTQNDAAMLGAALADAGFALAPRLREVVPGDADADLVVVMGGAMGVYERAQYPFLDAELALLADRLARGLPILGICLGAQLLAAAAGATVAPGAHGFEVGVGTVAWNAEAARDPVIGEAAPVSVVAHWHGDTFDAVPGAALLASSDRYAQQAFRLGASYGLQFHLELDADTYDSWLTIGDAELSARGHRAAELRAGIPRLRAAEPANRRLLARLAAHFAQRCASPRPGAR